MMDCLYLLDSNVISELSKPEVNENVLSQMKRKERFCAISAITLQEMQLGLELMPDGKKKEKIQSFVELIKLRLPVVPYEKRSAIVYGEVFAALQKKGMPRPICDTQIAATALANNMILVTRNIKDFAPIQKISMLKLENWFEL